MTALIKSKESLLDPLGSSPSLLLIQHDLSSPFSPILGQIVKEMLARQEPGSAAPGIDNLSFNLQLSDAQQQARASVPLPYTNEGKVASAGDGEIIYIPDQADDFDDDDPDDDLYI
ncbi:hypothetical protein V565_128660 [Rhizoctonia solani 123E]|uniref:Elongator complex protein 5 n=1 Tax=Rhizoctonia solani 123E TaxID=1423351 RepID=A0A074RUI7_9AGAM|nr:hypothetical protein V565_128660 [Rhizoctonia solani 123E]